MHGNVWEWVHDWSDEYDLESVIDPQGPEERTYRVDRGGSSSSAAGTCRSANRGSRSPAVRTSGLGFRLVMTLPEVANPAGQKRD